jgi:hypothetical protein
MDVGSLLPVRRRLVIAILLGGLCAGLCYARLMGQGLGGGDFTWAWRGARLLLAGQNPYHDPTVGPGNPYPYDAPLFYPLPAVLLALPFAPLPAELAAALFVGLSAGLLAYAVTREGLWRLTVFLGAPFWLALAWAQWSLLLLAAALLPALLPLVLAKPNIGAPLLLVYGSWRPWVASGVLGLVSLALLPSWPFDWLANLGENRHSPPVAIFLGPLLLLAALRWRDRAARLILLLAVVPQRLLFYDQVALWLVPSTLRESLALALCSWIGFGVWLAVETPSSATTAPYVLVSVYLPALAIVLLRRPAQGAPATEWQEVAGEGSASGTPTSPPAP